MSIESRIRITKSHPYLGNQGEVMTLAQAEERYAARFARAQQWAVAQLCGNLLVILFMIRIVFTFPHVADIGGGNPTMAYICLILAVVLTLLRLGRWCIAWDYFAGKYDLRGAVRQAIARDAQTIESGDDWS